MKKATKGNFLAGNFKQKFVNLVASKQLQRAWLSSGESQITNMQTLYLKIYAYLEKVRDWHSIEILQNYEILRCEHFLIVY